MRSLLVLALLAAPAAADPVKTPDVRAMHSDDCSKARAKNKPCVIDMGKGEEVDGNGVTPTGTTVATMPTANHNSLIHIRKDFIVEILKSAEDL